MNYSSVFITTSIPYVNASPHVGHAQEFVLTDALARLYRRRGHHVVVQTGTDENAFKNVISARIEGIDPYEFVTLNSAKFRQLADNLTLSFDSFIRTTDERHTRGVHLFWQSLKKDDLYRKSYTGIYCQGCEDFYLEKDLVDGVCPDHRTKPVLVEEENVFFKLSAYQRELDDLITSEKIKIVPANRKNEVLSFIRSGLQDISLTRDADRSGGWGIRVPNDPRQVIYVWIDALVNYLSGQGYGDSEKWLDAWNERTYKIHVIGKNVWKFHAIYWPALLLSAGLPTPNEIVIHGFLTTNGEKISKSLGNAIDPTALIQTYGADTIRNYLLSELSVFGDADFSEDGLRRSYNSDLANGLGNLVSRLAALCRKGNYSPILPRSGTGDLKLSIEVGDEKIQLIVQDLWRRLSQINAEINSTKPWELIKAGDHASTERLLDTWIESLYDIGTVLACFLPATGATLVRLIESGLSNYEGILFPRIE